MDALQIVLRSPHSLIERGPDGVVELLRVIDAHAGPLAPEHLHHNRKLLPYSHGAVVQMVVQARSPRLIHLVRTDPEVTISPYFGRGGTVPTIVLARVPLEWIALEPDVHSGVVVDLVRAIAGAIGCRLGWAHPGADEPGPLRGDPYQLVDAHWLDVLGPDLVATLGKDLVETTPVVAREWLPGGGVLLVTRTTPLDFEAEEAYSARARAFAHLTGTPEADALARLRGHSQRPQPVEKNFDPDVAEVLERLVGTALPSERGREIRLWNRFHPPRPTEKRPATEQPTSDVADTGEAIGRYESLYAEQLMALLHPHLPEIVRADPSSLPAVDVHFYVGDYPRHEMSRVIDDDLVPVVGGFLGSLMVKHLGGRWVPRQNIDDTAVIVGDIAWLPFLRARHYLASEDSALTHSLTQFYRAAARAR
jgi:hypothetical protein